GAVMLRDYFFFQAEDGIRGRTVTGVQTCALPILAAHLGDVHAAVAVPGADDGGNEIGIGGDEFEMVDGRELNSGDFIDEKTRARSEERRVGKERRGRRARYQAIKDLDLKGEV